MNFNWKRLLILIVFVAAVILVGYILYSVFLKTAPAPIQPGVDVSPVEPGVLPPSALNANVSTAVNVNAALPGVTNTNATPPPDVSPTRIVLPAATGGITRIEPLTQNPAYQPTLAANGNNAIYYDRSTSHFYEINTSGKATKLTDQVFYSVENITWSPNKQKAILEYPDGANVVYDFKTNNQVTLPNHWQDFDFSPNSDQLVFKSMGDNIESRWLAVSSSDGSQAKKITPLGDQDATVHPLWSPNNQIVAMYRESKDVDRDNLFFVGLNNENFQLTVLEGRGFQGQWSNEGDRLLYSVYSSATEYKPMLWIVEAQGENIGKNRKSLGLETWSDKCSFSNNDTVYCAVPKNLQEGAGIFHNDLDNSATDIYRIDLKSGFKSRIAIPEQDHNIKSVVVDQNQDYLYFESETDGRLYKINLK
jgi:hypothetical protein